MPCAEGLPVASSSNIARKNDATPLRFRTDWLGGHAEFSTAPIRADKVKSSIPQPSCSHCRKRSRTRRRHSTASVQLHHILGRVLPRRQRQSDERFQDAPCSTCASGDDGSWMSTTDPRSRGHGHRSRSAGRPHRCPAIFPSAADRYSAGKPPAGIAPRDLSERSASSDANSEPPSASASSRLSLNSYRIGTDDALTVGSVKHHHRRIVARLRKRCSLSAQLRIRSLAR